MEFNDYLDIEEDKIYNSTSILKEIEKSNRERLIIPLDSGSFDEVLGGGLHSGKKYLIFGSNRTGKTQLCHQICIQAYKYFLKESKNNNKKNPICTIYFDTENTFRPERIVQCSKPNNLDVKQILKSINVAKIMSNSSFLLKLKEIKEQEQILRGSVFIIDSINNYYRAEQGSKETSFYNIKTVFINILKNINELTKYLNLFTIATAQVSPNFIDNAIVGELPVGNQYLNHFFSEYLYLRSNEKDMNYIHLLNSYFLPEKKAKYKITSEGIRDYKI